MLLSVVIPVYNEADSLETLHQELCDVAGEHDYELDVVFVDDGSTDESWDVITRLAAADRAVRGIRFRRNFGKAAALAAGFHAVRGERVMTLDADLQDDPQEIPNFLAEMDRGHDVISGWKKVRHDPWHKVGPSRIFNWLVSRMTGVHLHDHNCGMKCYRPEIFREVRLYGELHRFVPVLAHARGFRVGEIVIQHRARRYGQSKYGVRRFVKGFLDLLTVKFLTGFGQRPQHLLGTIGLLSILLSGLGMAYLAVLWIASRLSETWPDVHLHESPMLLYCLGALLLGGQLFSIGFLAEMITAYQGRDVDTYSIAEQTQPVPSRDSIINDITESASHERSV